MNHNPWLCATYVGILSGVGFHLEVEGMPSGKERKFDQNPAFGGWKLPVGDGEGFRCVSLLSVLFVTLGASTPAARPDLWRAVAAVRRDRERDQSEAGKKELCVCVRVRACTRALFSIFTMFTFIWVSCVCETTLRISGPGRSCRNWQWPCMCWSQWRPAAEPGCCIYSEQRCKETIKQLLQQSETLPSISTLNMTHFPYHTE